MHKMKNHTLKPHPYTVSTSKNCFGDRLNEARSRLGLTQQVLAKKGNMTRVAIANWENGNAAPSAEIAARLAKILQADPEEFVLLTCLQKAATSFDLKAERPPEFLGLINTMLKKCVGPSKRVANLTTPTTHITLPDLLGGYAEPVVVVGDKREEDPQNIGDLFVFSACTVDDRWLSALGLPSSTEKISDKTFLIAPREWLKERFGRKTIITLGSPASNLFSREYNDHFLFRFAISREAKTSWDTYRDEMKGLQTPAALLDFRERHRADLRYTMRTFKQAGFIDFNYERLKVGFILKEDLDFAVISIGRNPFADPGEPYFSILVAGAQHPGTAHAVRFLAEPQNFTTHPFGGILEVQVPAKQHPRNEIHWYNKIEKSKPGWHTIGQSQMDYTPEGLCKQLVEHWLPLAEQNRIATDVEVTANEIQKHVNLIHLLAQAKSSEGFNQPA
jgi:transcriptional regulator with XRE-family HTH domain